ncbi:MAG: radical SAM protein [Methanoregula sp.]
MVEVLTKVLFVYPNKEGYPIIPLGISVLSGILKHNGHIVDLFDITFMVPEKLDHNAREKTGQVIKVEVDKYWGSRKEFDIPQEFRNKILDFQPDLIAFTIVENNYGCAKKLFKIAKETKKIPILVGGLFPTIAPDFFIEDENVDIICVGEGEYAVAELARRLDQNEDISNIGNLIVKHNGNFIKNDFYEYYNWQPLMFQDWEIFDERHLFKPFMGKMRKTGFFEISRGCPFNCSYCINKLSQEIFKCLGKYNREKPIELAIKEMKFLKEKHNLELIFFNDENFLTMRKERLIEFCREYKDKVDIPFFIMTRADSLVDEEKVKLLKETGCITIGIGVESGNEDIRMKLLNKKIPNSVYEKAFENCHKYALRASANIIIGLPFETEENIMESISFCKKLKADAISLAVFAPYYGTKLRDICIENGFIDDIYDHNISIIDHSILNMPQLSKERIKELYYNFMNIQASIK